jgi:hypothetical protein
MMLGAGPLLRTILALRGTHSFRTTLLGNWAACSALAVTWACFMAQEFRLDMVADADPVRISSRRCALAFSQALRLTRYVCRLRQSVPAETGVVSLPRSWSRGEKASREDGTGRGCAELEGEAKGQSGAAAASSGRPRKATKDLALAEGATQMGVQRGDRGRGGVD